MTTANLAVSARADNARREDVPPKKIRYDDRIAIAVGKRLGIKPSTAAHLIDELQLQMVVVLEELNRAGAVARKQRLMGRIRAADQGLEAPPLVAATMQLAQEADCREDVAETAYLSDQSDAHLGRLITASEEERRWQDARLMALLAERDRRRRMPS